MTLTLRYAARSDRGLLRGNNEDSVYAGPRLLAVADGMGGHAAGEVASKVVIGALEPLDEDTPGDDLLKALRQATINGTAHLREMIEEDPELEGMGTTLTAMLFAGNRIGLCHVGDSRAYLYRDGVLTQITHDDTFVQTLVDEGRITEEEAFVHPQRSLILRALNGSEVEPDLAVRETRAGDRYLLCTDGLADALSQETVVDALRIEDPDETADWLIELALRAGAPDNVTVIVADVVESGPGENTAMQPVVDGAAGDHAGAREVSPNSAAARAALANPPEPVDEPDDEEPDPEELDAGRRRKRRRRWVVTLVVLLVLVGLGFLGRWYVDSQYWVGLDDDEEVVIYNGVDFSVGPISLYSVAERTNLALDDLNEIGRNDARNGLSASSLGDARAIVERLRDQLLPPCPKPATPSASAPNTAAPPSSPAAPPSSAAPPSGSAAPTGSAGGQPQPGVDCRETP